MSEADLAVSEAEQIAIKQQKSYESLYIMSVACVLIFILSLFVKEELNRINYRKQEALH